MAFLNETAPILCGVQELFMFFYVFLDKIDYL